MGIDRKLEKELRRRRTAPPAGVVDGVMQTLTPASRPTRWSRAAFAAAVAVFVLGSFASFGGISYAASGVDHTYASAKQILVKHKLAVKKSSAAAQYNAPAPPASPPAPTGGTLGQTTHNAAPAASGTLPFTGVSLLGTLVLSLCLIGGGVLLRRRETRA